MEVVSNITNVEFGKMINAAASALKDNADKINKLNVFPVPDGDTGTNMTLSMASGAEYERQETDTTIGALAKATSKGLLMGARGNSGVILSQIFRGFASSVEGKTTLSARDFADALMGGAETAYKAVMKPTEGTILTVVREAAGAANQAAKEDNKDVVKVAQAAFVAAEAALATTPDLLPVLKEVGVVDSGGQGLVIVLEAFFAVLSGQEVGETTVDNAGLDAMIKGLHDSGVQGEINPADIKYGYCTEIMVDIAQGTTYDQKFDYDKFYNHLAQLGDSLLVINDDEVVKVHVHTENPGEVISWGTHFGSLRKVKVDNMRDQQVEAAAAAQATKAANKASEQAAVDLAVITIATGAGVKDLFASAGATVVLDGEQAPSTQDLVDAVKASGAKAAIILPNDSNIFMAAQQAVELLEIPTAVVKTRTIQQGLTSLVLGYNPNDDLTTVANEMTDTMAEVISGALTTSVRDTTLGGLEIHDGDAIGLLDGKITVAVADNDLESAAKQLLAQMITDEAEIVTIIFGSQSNQAGAQAIADAALAIDEDLEIEIHDGGQPLYPYLISVE
ncbi:glycerol kinase [Weissella oryzae SG25]|uniref:Glycerol kinase n=1 Tax=Weissella oryzae (strain DSM 25784 / JCM 18191 / LMG 30913 / SG25) TaxID=1329250 RepID=A0A069CTV2_WEIOS|nr:DAK2 domain-containing protein [Weissella oryzae]GAK30668.1 glycerol kinase [Weissella oryzae SG25]